MGSPTGCEPYGDGAFVVVVSVTPHQGASDSDAQGEGRQAGGREAARGARCAYPEAVVPAINRNAGYAERCMSGVVVGRWIRAAMHLASGLPDALALAMPQFRL